MTTVYKSEHIAGLFNVFITFFFLLILIGFTVLSITYLIKTLRKEEASKELKSSLVLLSTSILYLISTVILTLINQSLLAALHTQQISEIVFQAGLNALIAVGISVFVFIYTDKNISSKLRYIFYLLYSIPILLITWGTISIIAHWGETVIESGYIY